MKNVEKQEFRSSNVLTLLGLVGLSAILIATPWNRQIQDSRVQAARQKAEIVGYQVVQIYKETIKNSLPNNRTKDLRQPASADPQRAEQYLRNIGTMGTDPWGQPYHYRLLPSSKIGTLRILVWSAGPNQKMESNQLGKELALINEPSYTGDDIGIILSMSQN